MPAKVRGRYMRLNWQLCQAFEPAIVLIDLLDKGIDFVDDPIICQKNREERSQQPKSPAAAFPNRAERRVLDGKVYEVSGAVADIGEQGKNSKEEKRMQSECGTEMGPGQHDPGKDHNREDKVINDAARLPIADGIGQEQPAKRAGW
jgi:hypothetical protein